MGLLPVAVEKRIVTVVAMEAIQGDFPNYCSPHAEDG